MIIIEGMIATTAARKPSCNKSFTVDLTVKSESDLPRSYLQPAKAHLPRSGEIVTEA